MNILSKTYLQRRKKLYQFQIADGSIGADTNNEYIVYFRPLIKLWFFWKVIILLVDLYYINECYLWMAFREFYYFAREQLKVTNIILMSIYIVHYAFRLMMTPRLPQSFFNYLTTPSKVLIYLQHIIRYNNNGFLFLVYLIFLISFFLEYDIARWLHLIITFRIIQIDSLLAVIYTKIHIYKTVRVIYRIIILIFIIQYFTHVLACIFY